MVRAAILHRDSRPVRVTCVRGRSPPIHSMLLLGPGHDELGSSHHDELSDEGDSGARSVNSVVFGATEDSSKDSRIRIQVGHPLSSTPSFEITGCPFIQEAFQSGFLA